MKWRAVRLFFLGSLILAFVVAACGGGGTATKAPAASAPAAAKPTQAPQATAAPQPAATLNPLPSGQMTVAFSTLAGFEGLMVGGTTRNYLDALYDYTIGATVDGKLDPRGGFATSWDMSADGTTWTMKLRNDIKWHNGDQATAQDIVDTLKRTALPTSKRASSAAIRRDIVSMDTPDDFTLIVKLTGRNIFWAPNILSSIGSGSAPSYFEPKNYIAQVGDAAASRTPVGSGPYKWKSVVIDDRINLEAVDKHWLLGVPRTKSLIYRVVPDENTAIALLKTNEIDLMQISRAGAASLASAKDLHVARRENSGYGQMYGIHDQYVTEYPVYGKNPLNDVRVRQALFWYGVDRESMVKNFLLGQGTPAMDPNPWTPAYVKHALTPYDPAKAKALLKEAGYEKGFELDFLMTSRPALPEGNQIMEAMAVWWEGLGLKINRKPIDNGVLESVLLKGSQLPLGAFEKPTVSGMYFLGNGGIPNLTTSQPCTAPWPARGDVARDSDPKQCDLQKAALGPASVEAYIKTQQAVDEWTFQQVRTSTFFYLGELFAANAKVPGNWQIGFAPYAYRIERAATMR